MLGQYLLFFVQESTCVYSLTWVFADLLKKPSKKGCVKQSDRCKKTVCQAYISFGILIRARNRANLPSLGGFIREKMEKQTNVSIQLQPPVSKIWKVKTPDFAAELWVHITETSAAKYNIELNIRLLHTYCMYVFRYVHSPK